MKQSLYWLISSLLLLPLALHAGNFFHLEKLPQGQGTRVKLSDFIPLAASTPLSNAQLSDLSLRANKEGGGIPANIELTGTIQLNANLPGLKDQANLQLLIAGKIFSGAARGAAAPMAPAAAEEPLAVPEPEPVVFPQKESKGIEKPTTAAKKQAPKKESAAQAARAQELEDIFARNLSPVASIAQGVVSELPRGYQENAQGLLVKQEANQPAKVAIKTDTVYVLLDPDVATQLKTKEQVRNYRDQIERMPEWPGLVKRVETLSIGKPDIAPYIKEQQVTLPPEQMKTMMIRDGNYANPEIYQSGPNVYVRIKDNNYMVLSEGALTQYRDQPTLLTKLVRDQDTEFKSQKALLSKVTAPAPEPEAKPVPLVAPLTTGEIADTQSRFQKAIDALTAQERIADPERTAILEQRIKAIKEEQLYFNNAIHLERADINLHNLPILTETEQFVAKLPPPPPLPPARQTMQKKYDVAIDLLKTLPTSPETTTLLQNLTQERTKLGTAALTINALTEATTYLKAKGISLEQKVQAAQPTLAVLPEKPLTPLTPAQQALATSYEETITALKKMPSDAKTQRLIESLGHDQATIAHLTTPPKTTPALEAAQKYIAMNQKLAAKYLPEPLAKALEFESTKLPSGKLTEIAPGIKRSDSTGKVYVAIKDTPNQYMQFSEEIWKSNTPTQSISDLVQKAYQKSIAPAQPAKPAAPSVTPAAAEQPEQFFAQEATPDVVLKTQEPFAGHQIVSIVSPSGTVEPMAEQYVYIQSSSGKDYLFSKDVIKSGITNEQLKQYVDTREAHPPRPTPRLTYAEVDTAKQQINESLSTLAQLPKTEYSTNLTNELNAELARLNAPASPPTLAELPAIEKAQTYLAVIGTPPAQKSVLESAKEKAVQVKEKISTAATKVKTAIEHSVDKAINAHKDILSIGGALFIASLQNQNYKPFQGVQFPGLPPVDLPAVKDIELNNSELGIYFAPPKVFSIWVQGTGRVINIPLLAKVLFNYEPENTGIVLQAGLPESWKFSDSFSNMRAFDQLEIKRAYVYVSTINYIDFSIPTQIIPSQPSAGFTISGRPSIGILPGIMIRPGLSLYGEINLRKLIPEIANAKVLGLETASMYGTISYKPENILFGIGLPDLIKIENSPFKLGGMWLEIRGDANGLPDISLVIAMVIKPSPKDDTLTFTTRIATSATQGMVSLSMQGFWNNALGIEGLSVGDLAIQLHSDYKALITGVPITGFGFTGTVKFGTQKESPIITLAALYATGTEGQEVAMEGKVDGTISIWQIIDGCKSLAINLAKQQKKSTASIESDYNKILNNGTTKQLVDVAIRNVDIKIAPSTVYIGEFPIQQGLTAKGELTLLGVTSGLDFNLGQSGITATGYISPIKIGDFFSLTGTGKTKKYGIPDDAATISLALNFVEQHFVIAGKVTLLGISQETNIFIDADGINCSISGKLYNLFDASVVLKSRGDITHPDLYFKASMQQAFRQLITDQIKKSIQESAQDSVNKITAAQNDVDNLNKNIADLDRQINEHQTRIDQLGKNFIEGLKNSPEIVKLGLELTGLKTAQAGAVASRDTAKGVLEGAKRWVMGSDIIAQRLIDFGNVITVDLRDVAIESSIQDLAKGLLPHYTSTAIVFGKTIKLDMQLDFSSPEKAQQSSQAIGQQILTSLQTMLK